MTYKSSSQTVIFKYIFPAIMIFGGIFGTVALLNQGDEELVYFAYAYGIALIWVAFFLVQMPFRLKSILANDEGVIIKSRNGDKRIGYKEIRSVRKFDFTNPWMITLQYHDKNMMSDKKISYMPNAKYQKFMKHDDMTQYIIEQSKLNNPTFEDSNTLKNLLILAIAASPFMIGMIYFMSKSF